MSAALDTWAPRPTLAILVVGVALAAGLGTPWYLDYDEAAYVDVASTMVRSGDWLRPMSNCQPFNEKPVLFYWLVGALIELLGASPAVPRLVSLIAVLLGLAWLAREVTRVVSPAAAEIAVWVAGASLLPFCLGRLALLDALLVTMLTVSLLALRRGAGEAGEAPRRTSLILGYLAAGVACAVKGPVFPLLVALVLVGDALLRRDLVGTLRRSGLWWGVPLLLAVAAPSYLLVAQASGRGFLTDFLGAHTLGRALQPMQRHRGGPFYYLAVLAGGLLPFSAFLPGAGAALRGPAGDPRRLSRLAVVWAVVVVAAFTLAATKLPSYVAPAVPALAILVAVALTSDGGRRGAAWHVTLAAGLTVALAATGLTVALPRLAGSWNPAVLLKAPELAHLPGGVWPATGFHLAAAVLAAAVATGWVLARRGPALPAVRALGLGAALAWALLLVAAGSLVDRVSIDPVRRLAAMASRDVPPGRPLHLVEMSHRMSARLETGRCTVFMRARTPEERAAIRALLAGDETARVIVSDAWWRELGGEVGGRVMAQDGAWLLVGQAGGTP